MVSVVSWSVFILRITLLSKLILINIGTEYRSVQTKEIHHITLETALIWRILINQKLYGVRFLIEVNSLLRLMAVLYQKQQLF